MNNTNNSNLEYASVIDRVNASLKRRYARERRFRRMGQVAVLLGLLFVSFLFLTIVGNGYTAFQQTSNFPTRPSIQGARGMREYYRGPITRVW